MRRRVEVVRYAPAIVGFVSVGGNIGWFPLHPRDRFVPWWGRRERVVENVTFVNAYQGIAIGSHGLRREELLIEQARRQAVFSGAQHRVFALPAFHLVACTIGAVVVIGRVRDGAVSLGFEERRSLAASSTLNRLLDYAV